MAAAGIGSRRHCEELIRSGRVEVDRRVVRELGTRVDPSGQEIRVDGTVLPRARRVYFLVNKPPGVVSTNFDPSGRPRVVDLVGNVPERLFTVGRLDLSSEGLMLVTNDGQLANELAHPSFGIEKTYHVLVAGTPDLDVLSKLRQGIHLAEAVARVVSVRVRHSFKQSTLLEIVLAEGRNREIRRLLAKVGHKVLKLKRVALGPVRLGDLEPGEVRALRSDELKLLRHGVKSPRRRRAVGRRPRRGGRRAGASEPSQADPHRPPVGLPPTGSGLPPAGSGLPAGKRGPSRTGKQAAGARPRGRRRAAGTKPKRK